MSGGSGAGCSEVAWKPRRRTDVPPWLRVQHQRLLLLLLLLLDAAGGLAFGADQVDTFAGSAGERGRVVVAGLRVRGGDLDALVHLGHTGDATAAGLVDAAQVLAAQRRLGQHARGAWVAAQLRRLDAAVADRGLEVVVLTAAGAARRTEADGQCNGTLDQGTSHGKLLERVELGIKVKVQGTRSFLAIFAATENRRSR